MYGIVTKVTKTKRPGEFEDSGPNKRFKVNFPENSTILPKEMWRHVANYLDEKSSRSIRLANQFFFAYDAIYHDFYQQFITRFFDCKHKEELSFLLNQFAAPPDFDTTSSQLLIKSYCDMADEVKTKLDLGEYSTDEVYDHFLDAAQRGYIQLINFFIESTLYPIATIINLRDEDKSITALGNAAANCRKQIFSLLLENGAQFVNGEVSPLNNSYLVYFELGYFHRFAVTPLHIIAYQSDENWLCDILDQFPESLTSAGFSESYQKHLRYIIKNEHEALAVSLETNKLVLQEEDPALWSLLHWAACCGSTECISVLIDKGINVNVEAGIAGMCPLDIACTSGKLDTFKKLASYGAVISEVFDSSENTYLHLTVSNGYIEFTEYLIVELQMNVNAKNVDDGTPLFLARLQVDSAGAALSPEKIAMKAICADLLVKYGATESMQTGN